MKGYYIKKRKTFDLGNNSIRSLVLVEGNKAKEIPLNKMIKNLRLHRDYHFVSDSKNKVILERIYYRKQK